MTRVSYLRERHNMDSKTIKRNLEQGTDDRAGRTRTNSKPPLKLTRRTMVDLYAAQKLLPLAVQKEIGLRMPVEVYFKDPLVARLYADIGIDDEFTTPWEPGLRDGPTSARFAVVDY